MSDETSTADGQQQREVMPTGKNDEWPIRGRFRKKYQPQGVRICEETLAEINGYDDCAVIRDHDLNVFVEVRTHEGTLRAFLGDWVFEDSQGRHYPIEHEEVTRIYEPVEQRED